MCNFLTRTITSVNYFVTQIHGSADCCREDPILDLPITIGTYPILLSNTLGLNSTITQQPTPLAAYPSNNYGLPSATTNVEPTPPYPSAPSFSSVDGIGKAFCRFSQFVVLRA